MEMIERNFINSADQISVESNTTSAKNIFSWDIRKQYLSDGFNNDLTSTTLTISFDDTQTVSRLALMEHNLKSFSIYYDGTATNLFTMSATADTVSSSYSNNSNTSQYMFVDQVFCTSVSLKMDSTIEGDFEKAVGLFVISNLYLDFPRIPNSGGYKPKIVPDQVIHKLSDGGVRKHKTGDKKEAQIKFSNIAESFRNDLKAVYDLNDSLIFVPFGTTTSWDEIIFDAIWTNDFEFYKYSDDASEAGFGGKINLEEIS